MKVQGLFKNAQRTHTVPTGAAVFVEGQPGTEMFGIIDGEIELRAGERLIATLGPDEVFGETALIDSAPRMATAVAQGHRARRHRHEPLPLPGARDAYVRPVGHVGDGGPLPDADVNTAPRL